MGRRCWHAIRQSCVSTITKDVNVNTDSCNLSTKNSVAVFDLFDSLARERPLALLQPTPSLKQLFPQFDAELIGHSTYFGRTKDGSHFAMSPEHFPLVVFHNGNLS